MEKTGQRRGKWEKFKEEKLHPGGRLMEHFSPEFSELMENLREVDEKVREIAAPDDKDETLKAILQVAHTNFNRREYMTAISFLGQFQAKLEAMDRELSTLQNTVDMKHYEFLFGDVDPEHMKYLSQIGDKFNKNNNKGISSRAALESNAGIIDWWKGLDDNRHSALSAWEKRFPKYVTEIKKQTGAILSKAESVLTSILMQLKEMNGLRNARRLEEYLKAAKKMQEKIRGFNSLFASYYNNYVQKFLVQYGAIADESSLKVTPDSDLPTFSQPPPSPIQSVLPSEPEQTEITPAITKMKPGRMPLDTTMSPFPEYVNLDTPQKEKNINTKETVSPKKLLSPPKNEEEANAMIEALRKEIEKDPFKPAIAQKDEHFGNLSQIMAPSVKSNSIAPVSMTLDPRNPVIPLPPRMPNFDEEKSLSELFPSVKTPITFNPAGLHISPDEPTILSPGTPPKRTPTIPFTGFEDIKQKETPKKVKQETIPFEKPKKAKNHQAFLQSLASSFENDHPLILCKKLLSYAEEIELSDPETSNKLKSIARNLEW
jgi:hypothetical protein